MIERQVFFNSSEIEPVDQRTCAPGFFRSVLNTNIAEALVLGTIDDVRYIVDLTEGDRQFMFYLLHPGDRSRRLGMLTRDVTVEVDREGAYDAGMLTGSSGDMILSNGKWYIMAVNTGGFRDVTALGLWDAADLSAGTGEIGFRSWRLTIGSEKDRRVLWQRTLGG